LKNDLIEVIKNASIGIAAALRKIGQYHSRLLEEPNNSIERLLK